MGLSHSKTTLALAVCGAALLATSVRGVAQQPAAAAPQGQPASGRAGGGGRGGAGAGLFTAVDANKDGSVTRDELKTSFDGWFTSWDTSKSGSISQAQLAAGLTAALPAPAPPAAQQGPDCGGRSSNPRTPCAADVEAMMAALPATAPAKPAKARKILVLGTAQGFVHSSIPLAAKTMEALGDKTKAWSTVITYDPADINEQNLKQYDAVFLDSTTGCFLDDGADKSATAARRAALMNFVRSGKGIAAIHAATDSYHGVACPGDAPAAPAAAPAAAGGGRGGAGGMLAAAIFTQADQNNDQKVTRQELGAVADAWFDKLDTDKAGKLSQAEFTQRFAGLMPAPAPQAARSGAPGGNPLWPEFNKMIGGYFKFHWNDPQEITYKIDDPASPLTAMFKGAPLVVHDETYTFNQESFSRTNVHVLTSVDYAKMSDADKAKEPTPRTDHDYALSYIKREGNGRIFYMSHGHSERNYAVTSLLEHLLAGVQYALGDLKADDSPSVKAKK